MGSRSHTGRQRRRLGGSLPEVEGPSTRSRSGWTASAPAACSAETAGYSWDRAWSVRVSCGAVRLPGIAAHQRDLAGGKLGTGTPSRRRRELARACEVIAGSEPDLLGAMVDQRRGCGLSRPSAIVASPSFGSPGTSLDPSVAEPLVDAKAITAIPAAASPPIASNGARRGFGGGWVFAITAPASVVIVAALSPPEPDVSVSAVAMLPRALLLVRNGGVLARGRLRYTRGAQLRGRTRHPRARVDRRRASRVAVDQVVELRR